jgi:hypothetical protein
LALALRVPTNRITEIVRGRRRLSVETALWLGNFFGTGAQMADAVRPLRLMKQLNFRPSTHCTETTSVVVTVALGVQAMATAASAGKKPNVADRRYLRPDEARSPRRDHRYSATMDERR